MKVHHLNCGTMCPVAAHWLNDESHLVCHCLLIETSEGLVLIETGFGLEDLRSPVQRLGWLSTKLLGAKFDEAETAIRQVEALGFSADDVRHIIPTHLDLDHAGGLSDFPKATVHTFATEYHAAMHPGWFDKTRYRSRQWAHQPKWEIYKLSGETWFDFSCVRQLKGLPPEILMVPLVGHSQGHCGIAIDSDKGWLFHCGDAYFHHNEVHTPEGVGTRLMELFQTVVQDNGTMRHYNQQRLRELAAEQQGKVHVFCSHDPSEFQAFTNTTANDTTN